MVLFDGEEFGRPSLPDYCKGSIHFAKQIRTIYPTQLPMAAIVIDMVGDRELEIKREQSSNAPGSRWLNDLIWAVGGRQAPGVFANRIQSAILDDQTSLQRLGIPAVLLIDFSYPRQHFDLSLELSDGRGFLTPDQRFDITARTDRSAVLLLLNIDQTGTVSVLYPIHDRELRQTSGLRETFEVVPPYGTEYLKLFAFRRPPAGLSRWLNRRIDALDPEFAQLLRLLSEPLGGGQTRLKVVTVGELVSDGS